MDRRLRLLFVTPFPPRLDGDHGGALSTAHLIAEMAAHHEVAILCFRTDAEAPVDATLGALCARVEEVPHRGDAGSPVRRVSRAVRLGMAPLGGVPQWAAAFRDRRFAGRLRSLVRDWRPDLVQVEFHVMGQYAPVLAQAGVPMVLVEHEPGLATAVERAWRAPATRRPWHRLNVAAWRRFERTVIEAARAVVVFTERDRQAVLALSPGADVTPIPITRPLPEAAASPAEGRPGSLLFVGNFEHPPNQDAAIRLAVGIFPRIRARHPEAELVVLGPSAPQYVASDPSRGVIVLDRVPNVGPYLAEAAVVVIPLFTGGGMRLKVLDAIGLGKAVVASPLAVEGLDLVDGVHVLLAGGDAAFADRVTDLLRDDVRRAEIGRQARLWAEQHLRADRVRAAYETLYTRILSVPS